MQDRVLTVRRRSWKGFLSSMVALCARASPMHACFNNVQCTTSPKLFLIAQASDANAELTKGHVCSLQPAGQVKAETFT